MIKLSGLSLKSKHDNPDGDIEIIYTGLRPGKNYMKNFLLMLKVFLLRTLLFLELKKISLNMNFLKEIELLKEKITEKDTNACIKILKNLFLSGKLRKFF